MSKKIKKPFWLPINVETYRANTADLSTLEHGACLLLRLHYWCAGPMKNDDKILARIAGLQISEWRKVRPALERFFEIGEQWINTEWDGELEIAYGRIQKASESGIKGNNIRWEQHRKNKEVASGSDRVAIGLRSECDPNPNPNYKIGGATPYDPPPSQGGIGISSGAFFDETEAF